MPDANVLTTVIGQVGVAAILAWYLWYNTSTETPRARMDFLKAIDSLMSRYIDLSRDQAVTLEQMRKAIDRLSDTLGVERAGLRGPAPPR